MPFCSTKLFKAILNSKDSCQTLLRQTPQARQTKQTMSYDNPHYGRFASDPSTIELIEEIDNFRRYCTDTELRFDART